MSTNINPSINNNYSPFRTDHQAYTLDDVIKAAWTPGSDKDFWMEVFFQILLSSCMRGLGFILVIFVISIITLLAYEGLFIVVPIVSEGSTLQYIMHYVNGFVCLICIYFHYIMAVYTDPGSPDSKKTDLDDPDESNGKSLCKKCNIVKPLRTHHCSMCRKCILKMDHHCPYVNNW